MNTELLQILKEFSWEVRKGNVSSVLLSYAKGKEVVVHSFGDYQGEILKTINEREE